MRTSTLPSLAALAALIATTPLAHATGVDPALDTWTCLGTCGTLAADGDITLSPYGSPRYAYLTTNGSTAHGVSPLAIVESGGGGAEFSQTNGSSYTSAPFTLADGQDLRAYFNYVSTDGKGFDDYAWARLVNGNGNTAAWLFTARSTNGNKQNVVPGNALDKASNNGVAFDPDQTIVDYADFEFNTRTTQSSDFDPIDWSPLGIWNGTCWRDNAEGCGFSGWLESRVTPGAGTYRLEVGVVNFGDEAWDSGIAFDLQGLSAPQTVPLPSALYLLLSVTPLLAARGRRRAASH
ncbi:MAG: NF038132 family protein [Proteobacteria bacterium]|nr:NF038132 family protein [Pseudomonadota bacterium]